MRKFGISAPLASSDPQLFDRSCPGTMTYNVSEKCHLVIGGLQVSCSLRAKSSSSAATSASGADCASAWVCPASRTPATGSRARRLAGPAPMLDVRRARRDRVGGGRASTTPAAKLPKPKVTEVRSARLTQPVAHTVAF